MGRLMDSVIDEVSFLLFSSGVLLLGSALFKTLGIFAMFLFPILPAVHVFMVNYWFTLPRPRHQRNSETPKSLAIRGITNIVYLLVFGLGVYMTGKQVSKNISAYDALLGLAKGSSAGFDQPSASALVGLASFLVPWALSTIISTSIQMVQNFFTSLAWGLLDYMQQ